VIVFRYSVFKDDVPYSVSCAVDFNDHFVYAVEMKKHHQLTAARLEDPSSLGELCSDRSSKPATPVTPDRPKSRPKELLLKASKSEGVPSKVHSVPVCKNS